MEKKYRLTEETREHNGRTLHRIQALRDFGNVQKGDLGGWIEKEKNLSHDGNCWVSDNAKVYGFAKVSGSAEVCGDAIILNNEEDYIVFKNWWSSGRFFAWTRSNNMWKVGCFYGTGQELIDKAYSDSEESGREYERIVNYVQDILGEPHLCRTEKNKSCG